MAKKVTALCRRLGVNVRSQELMAVGVFRGCDDHVRNYTHAACASPGEGSRRCRGRGLKSLYSWANKFWAWVAWHRTWLNPGAK